MNLTPNNQVRYLIFSLLFWLCSFCVQAEQVTFAVASNFKAAAQQLAAEYNRQSGDKVRLVFGASGKLYSQIKHGAPFDGLLAADQKTVDALELSALALENSRFTYARGRLVLWSPGKPLPTDKKQFFTSGAIQLAIANPRLAPYGRAAEQAVQRLSQDASMSIKLITGENVSQAFQFTASGNVDAGIIALSHALVSGLIVRNPNGKLQLPAEAWLIPQHYYDEVLQDAVLLKQAKDNTAAKAFMAFLASEQGRILIQTFGYQTQGGNAL